MHVVFNSTLEDAAWEMYRWHEYLGYRRLYFWGFVVWMLFFALLLFLYISLGLSERLLLMYASVVVPLVFFQLFLSDYMQRQARLQVAPEYASGPVRQGIFVEEDGIRAVSRHGGLMVPWNEVATVEKDDYGVYVYGVKSIISIPHRAFSSEPEQQRFAQTVATRLQGTLKEPPLSTWLDFAIVVVVIGYFFRIWTILL